MELNPRIQTLLEFLQEDPHDASTKYMLALEYVKMGNDAEARKWMQENYEQHPDYLPNYYHYGKLIEKSGDHEGAGEIFTHGMKIARAQQNNHTFNELRGAFDLLDT